MTPLIILIPLVLVRWSRWLAIVQQKEYRIDRLSGYLKSREGKKELLRITPKLADFTREGFKRPRPTARIIFIWLISSLPVICFLWSLPALDLATAFVLGIIGYVFLPILIFLSVTPSYLISEAMTMFVLHKAKMLVDKNHPKVVGITGSYGKTSTKLLLAHVLGGKYKVFTTPRSFNQRYSVARSVLENYRGQELMVMEYAAYKTDEIKELAHYIKPTLAVITGLTNQHLSTFGNINDIIRAKSELVIALEDKSEVFYNGRDAGALKIAEVGKAIKPVDYAAVKDLRASLSNDGKLTLEWKSHKLRTKLVGMHYLGAVEAAITLGLYLGLSEREIVAGLTSFEPGENFVRTRELKNGALLLDDGRTANQVGFRAAIDLLGALQADLRRQNTLMIFAGIIDLGDESTQTHRELASYAKDIINEVLYVGTDGLREFRDVFGKRLIANDAEVIKRLKNIDRNTIVLLEGYIPQKYETYLQ